jgi:CheY-like chemotaxis protein
MLLDLKMPMIDGFEVLTWWQEHEHEGNLPIIVMSSSNHESDIKRAMALGAKGYEVKPSSFGCLLGVVRELGQRWLVQGADC